MFFCEFYEISKNTILYRKPLVAASIIKNCIQKEVQEEVQEKDIFITRIRSFIFSTVCTQFMTQN